MSAKQSNSAQKRNEATRSHPAERGMNEPDPSAKPPLLSEKDDRGEPGGGQGRLDVTANVPDDFRVDPNITEGHDGYEESGRSEIHASTKKKSTESEVEKRRPR